MDKKEAILKLLQAGELPTKERIRALTKPSIGVRIIKNYNPNPSKIKVEDFVLYFRQRYEAIKAMLISRVEVDPTSISRLTTQESMIIAFVREIQKFQSGAVKLRLEDPSGEVNAIVSPKNPELAKTLPYITYDEICAFKGRLSSRTFFVNEIIWPDVPIKERKLASDIVYALFTGDIHAGSNMFLPENLNAFINWLKSDDPIAQATKYIFVVGDIVDGVGIYPEQERELLIKDIYAQYQQAAEFLSQIPEDKQIIICPGNHDVVRMCEPQPPLYKDIAEPLYELPNVIMVSNPALVNIHASEESPGFDVLLYHGYSFDYFVDAIEALREAGGYDRPDKLIEFLLRRRHLAPTYGSTLALPFKEDPLLIRTVPDIVATGHIHKAMIGQYKNILTISASCWQKRTAFQERVGHNPDPAMVPIVNLKTGQAKMLSFK